MAKCIVTGCNNRSSVGNKISFHCIPAILYTQGIGIKQQSEKRKQKWINALNQERFFKPDFKFTTGHRVCGKHFVSGKPSSVYEINNPDWVPSVDMGYKTMATNNPQANAARYRRAIKRTKAYLTAETSAKCQINFNQMKNNEPADLTIEESLSNEVISEIPLKADFSGCSESNDSSSQTSSSLTIPNSTTLKINDLSKLEQNNLKLKDQILVLKTENKQFRASLTKIESEKKKLNKIISDQKSVIRTFEIKLELNQDSPLKKISQLEIEKRDVLKELENLKNCILKLQEREKELESENEMLRRDEVETENMPSYKMDEDYMKSDETRMTYYTGIPNFGILTSTFNLLSSPLQTTMRSKLTHFEEFLVFLIWLKLNLDMKDLAYRFKVSPATVSRICDEWLELSFVRLNRLIRWPSREELQLTMPNSFKKSFGNKVCVIIDFIEIFIECPSSLDDDKHHNTMKFFIGASPQGAIIYISEAWGCCTPDVYITENCGILENLIPGDLVLADCGFNIEMRLDFYCAQVAIPSKTIGKKQLSPTEIMEKIKIANTRLNIERDIELFVNKFRILKSTIPIDYLQSVNRQPTKLDKIVKVCCALNNLCDPISYFD